MKEIKNILEINSLSFCIWNETILDKISLDVKAGEILSIIGMNGTGKSSLLKIIAGIYKKTSGTITRNYKTLWYVPQKLDLDTSLPLWVTEFISIYNSKTHIKNIDEYFSKFNCKDLLKKNIRDLSGWELQKVLIIWALLSEPELLLLDEPTSGIDVVGEEIFYKNIAEVQTIFPNIATILVSHNLHLVYKNSDRVICLHKNNYCCHGTPSEVLADKKAHEIFSQYVLPYEHNPHEKHSH